MAAPNQIVLYNYGSNYSLILHGNNDLFSQVRGGRRREKELKNWDFTVYRTLALGFTCTILLYPLHKPSDYVLSLITGKEAKASRYSGICIFHLGHLSSERHWIIRCGWLNANPSPKWKSSWKTCLIDQELTISDTKDISLLSLFTFFLDYFYFFLH